MITIKCPKCKTAHQLAKKNIVEKTGTLTAFKCKKCAYGIKLKIKKN